MFDIDKSISEELTGLLYSALKNHFEFSLMKILLLPDILITEAFYFNSFKCAKSFFTTQAFTSSFN